MVYGRERNGRETTFGTTGYTYNNTFVLYDRADNSIWYPLHDDGLSAVGGESLGRKIEYLAKPDIVTLGEWRRAHPNTDVVLSGHSETNEPATNSDESSPNTKQDGT